MKKTGTKITLKEARITMMISASGATNEISDNDTGIQFAEITLDAEGFLKCLSRHGHVECVAKLNGLEKLGKVLEMKPLSFPVNIDGVYGADARRAVAVKAMEAMDLGDWEPDTYFGSRDSFYKEGGRDYAKTTLRRFVAPAAQPARSAEQNHPERTLP
jgi:hypothetical protein